jgi:acetyl esterase/lipase
MKFSFPSVFILTIGTAVGLPVVVWIHGGGYVYSSIKDCMSVTDILRKVSEWKHE